MGCGHHGVPPKFADRSVDAPEAVRVCTTATCPTVRTSLYSRIEQIRLAGVPERQRLHDALGGRPASRPPPSDNTWTCGDTTVLSLIAGQTGGRPATGATYP